METNAHYAAVGAFMILLIAAAVMAIIWLSSGFSFQAYTVYKINMTESVTGLNIDSPVEFNGVTVGSVKSIDLDHTNPNLVDVLIFVKSSTPVTRGTIATLTTRGVTGVTFIAMKDKGDNLVPLKPAPGESYAVIKTGPSIFMRLDTALNQLSDNLHQVTISISSLLNKENLLQIKNILVNVSSVTANLSDNNERLSQIIENTAKASKDFLPVLSSAANAMRTFQIQTLPTTYQLLNNLDRISRTLNDVSLEIKQNPSMLIRGISRQPNGPGEVK